MKIHYASPYGFDGIGKAYNEEFDKIKMNDWLCLVDQDAMFQAEKPGHQIKYIVEKYPDVGMFTCLTNRVKNKNQLYPGAFSVYDMVAHARIAADCQRKYYDHIKFVEKYISGVLMLIKKSTWKKVGKFSESNKVIGIDTEFSRRLLKEGYSIAVMQGVYITHSYRMLKSINDISHLK